MHVDPSVHGLDEQSLMLLRQSSPVKPGAHWQVNHFSVEMHVPPLWQGDEVQKSAGGTSILLSHNVPL
jgi:hypothetical protein